MTTVRWEAQNMLLWEEGGKFLTDARGETTQETMRIGEPGCAANVDFLQQSGKGWRAKQEPHGAERWPVASRTNTCLVRYYRSSYSSSSS